MAGKVLVTETTYDDRGQLRDATVEQALSGTGGRYIAGGTWLNRTRHAYDELGREVRSEWLRGTTPVHATTTAYGLDSVTVTGPDGRRVRERTDGLGRTVAAEEFDGQAWVTSRYGYDLADRLLTVTDPAGNRSSYTVNRVGWRTSQQDPDRGSASFTFDNAGRQLSAADALGRSVHTAYDALGRPVARRSGSATGPLLASWQYDTAPGGKGRSHRETTHTATGNWVSETLGYDSKGRPTGSRLTVPAGIPGLSGSYTLRQTYDRADRVRTVTYPAIGGLPEEMVTAVHNTFGLPTRLTGIDEYVWNVAYDDRGRRLSAGLGPRPGGATWMARTWIYDLDQRVTAVETFVAGAGVMSRHDLAFDLAGNLTEKLTRQGGQSWRECFGYDQRSRLRAAHTVAATASCASGTPGTGDRPYTHQYTYSADGRMTARTEEGVSTAYTYPAAGAARPHAPTRVGADTYTWDATGSLTARTVGGRTETFTWDAQNRLASVAGPGGTTSFVYDTAGQRLLRRTPDGRATLYVAGHEVTANPAGTIVSAVRSYTFDGQLVATRTAAGVEYVIADASGSVEAAAPSGGAAPSASQAYEPYGQVRAQTGDTATDRGFLGQVEDASTSLSYLNARYYDAAAGVFISADPVYNPSRPKTINPYAYSVNNPTTYSDPGGAYSEYTFGQERINAALQNQVRQLIGHVKKLNGYIAELQSFIREQQSYIKNLLAHIEALEAEIARQQTIIRRLQAHIAALQREVSALRAENSKLRAHIARQAGIIRYYKGIVNVLGFRLWAGTPHLERVMRSIHSFQGIPAGAFAVDNISALQAQLSLARGLIDRKLGQIDSLQDNLRESRAETRGANARIDDLGDIIDGMAGGQAAQRNRIRDLENSVEGLEEALRKAHDYSGGDFLKDLHGLVNPFADVFGILCDSGHYQWQREHLPDWMTDGNSIEQYC
jgi:RHS repeat-associated protein